MGGYSNIETCLVADWVLADEDSCKEMKSVFEEYDYSITEAADYIENIVEDEVLYDGIDGLELGLVEMCLDRVNYNEIYRKLQEV